MACLSGGDGCGATTGANGGEYFDAIFFDVRIGEKADAGAPALPTVVLERSVEVPGILQTLFAVDDGCEIISLVKLQGSLRLQPQPSIVTRFGAVIDKTILPNAAQRSYGWPTRLSDKNIISPYQSTGGSGSFSQTGLEQGLIVTDQNGGVIADKNILREHGLTRPVAVLEHEGKITVVANNGEPNVEIIDGKEVVLFKRPSAIIVYDPANIASDPGKVYELLGVYNANTISSRPDGLGGNVLVIGAAGSDYITSRSEPGKIVLVDPKSFTIKSVHPDMVAGLGLGGVASVMGAQVLLTGSAPNNNSIALFTPDNKFRPVPLPKNLVAQYGTGLTDIPGALFVTSSSFLFNIWQPPAQGSETRTYIIDTDGQSELLGTPVASNFAIAPAQYGSRLYCTGAAQTRRDVNGNTFSQVTFWSIPQP